MAGQNRNSAGPGRSGRGAASTPPAGRTDRLSSRTSPAEAAARSAVAETQMRVYRYPSPLPLAASATERETAALLLRQNELLTEILTVLSGRFPTGPGR